MTVQPRRIARMTPKELREFVMGMADGRIITSDMVDPNLVALVFMPLALGALGLPDDVFPDAAPTPPEPFPPLVPLPEVAAPAVPPAPVPPAPVTVPPDVLEDVRWGRLPPHATAAYDAAVRAYDAVLAEWESTVHQAWRDECETLRRAHEAAVLARDADVDAQRAEAMSGALAHAKLVIAHEAALAEHEAQRAKVHAAYWADLGCVYEYMHNAGPRGINGLPMFPSMHLVHRDDVKRAYTAYEREVARRNEFTIEDTP